MNEKKDKAPAQLDRWLERDLTALARSGELPRAFRRDSLLSRFNEALTSGRNVILSGEPGVGKSALMYELVDQATRGEGPEVLRNKRILQVSIRRCSTTLGRDESLGASLVRMASEVEEADEDIVLYFRDFHLAWNFDLEAQFASLPFRITGPVLGEGLRRSIVSCLEFEPELENQYVVIDVPEPSLRETREILRDWAKPQRVEGRDDAVFTDEALETSLQLSHRFLARSHLPRKALEPLSQLARVRQRSAPILAADVIERFCEAYHLPRFLVDPAIPLDLERLAEHFRSRILGQEDALSSVIDMICRIKAGLVDARRPFGAFLFVGPTGVGKTHLAQLLAEYLFGSPDRMIRFNMADYQEPKSAELLFGDPEDNRMQMRRGVLTQRVMGFPFAVLLLDEFEKANAQVHDRFLQLFDEGCFANAAGELISCRSVILIATSNAGAQHWRGGALGFAGASQEQEVLKLVDHELRQHFRFEFLNRFDDIVHFRPLRRPQIRAIALRELEGLRERSGLRQRQLDLQIDEGVLDWLTAHGYDPQFGARFLRRTLERHVSSALAALLVRETPEGQSRIELSIRAQRVRARWAEQSPTPRREPMTVAAGTEEKTKVVDRDAVLEEGRSLRDIAEARLTSLRERRQEYESLLAEINAPGFWDQAPDSGRLDRFRSLDVAIRVENRLAPAVEDLIAGLSDDSKLSLEQLARVVGRASQALREWEERAAEDSAQSLWLLISNQDALHKKGRWIEDLVEMERRWCRRLALEAEVVAYSMRDGQVVRVALEVTGPGAEIYLKMEEGLHRRHLRHDQDLRARIQILPVSERPEPPPPVREAVKREERLGMIATATGSLELRELGIVEEFLGSDAATLAHFLADARVALDRVEGEPTTVARIYGESGHGARDPRTGEVIPRLRDALHGRLDRLLERWRRSVSVVRSHPK